MKVQPKRFNPQMIEALERDLKKATRRTVTAGNSIVEPGQFENVDLDTGRARIRGDRTEIRARCTFASGVRVVSILPTVRPSDVLWVRKSRKPLDECSPALIAAQRRRSQLTLAVWAVEVARVQDMTEQDARDEGVGSRAEFQALWESINGRDSWRRNPWVWVYKFATHHVNVDEWLKHT